MRTITPVTMAAKFSGDESPVCHGKTAVIPSGTEVTVLLDRRRPFCRVEYAGKKWFGWLWREFLAA